MANKKFKFEGDVSAKNITIEDGGTVTVDNIDVSTIDVESINIGSGSNKTDLSNFINDSVKFYDNITITETFGKYKPTATKPVIVEVDKTNGLSIQDFIRDALCGNDVTTGLISKNPSVTVTLSKSGKYEPGASVTIATSNISRVFSDGAYKYEPFENTGVTETSYKYVGSDGVIYYNNIPNETSVNSGSKTIEIKDTTNYTVTCTSKYTQGSIPKSLLGKEQASQRIQASSTTGTSGSVKGERKLFFGTFDGKTTGITSANIRSLGNNGWVSDYSKNITHEFAIKSSTTVIWAYPIDYFSDQTPSFTYDLFGNPTHLDGVEQNTMTVNGFNNNSGTGTTYNVCIFTPPEGSGETTYRMKITKNK